MSPSQDQQHTTAEAAARMKDDMRQSRFSFRNRAEYLLRRDMKEEALQTHCKTQVSDFASCAQEQGLFVVFTCQPMLKKLNECLAIHNGEEAWERYKEAHKEELERRSRGEKI
uniref:COX assembly mitochondrial protein n=1 Tax=Amphora coffeiformis TaxID=265554 RepID=A0A7S3P8B7_9STRA|eukprot:scaffold9208_cov154-Amphora_coffeaeformis.AAC.1